MKLKSLFKKIDGKSEQHNVADKPKILHSIMCEIEDEQNYHRAQLKCLAVRHQIVTEKQKLFN
jgi:hypothetical protein